MATCVSGCGVCTECVAYVCFYLYLRLRHLDLWRRRLRHKKLMSPLISDIFPFWQTNQFCDKSASSVRIRTEIHVGLNTTCRMFWTDFNPNRDVKTDLFYVILSLGFRRRVAVDCFVSLQKEICTPSSGPKWSWRQKFPPKCRQNNPLLHGYKTPKTWPIIAMNYSERVKWVEL